LATAFRGATAGFGFLAEFVRAARFGPGFAAAAFFGPAAFPAAVAFLSATHASSSLQ
jgi:hypothetical protein